MGGGTQPAGVETVKAAYGEVALPRLIGEQRAALLCLTGPDQGG
jgi:enoyl-CoA hydratase/carnithine racemase